MNAHHEHEGKDLVRAKRAFLDENFDDEEQENPPVHVLHAVKEASIAVTSPRKVSVAGEMLQVCLGLLAPAAPSPKAHHLPLLDARDLP